MSSSLFDSFFGKKVEINEKSEKEFKDDEDFINSLPLPKIKVFGVGGCGGNLVSSLYSVIKDSQLITTIALNTDAGQLNLVRAHKKILIGLNTTRGRGTGGNYHIGRRAFEESKEKIEKEIQGSDLVIVVGGLGGGTGSGAIPPLIELINEFGILSMVFVTLPFQCEGKLRIRNSITSLSEILKYKTCLMVVANERLLKLSKQFTVFNGLNVISDLVVNLIRSFENLITKPGLINVDFSDLIKVLSFKGLSIGGTSEFSSSEKGAHEVSEKILRNPLFNVNPGLSKACLIDITGSEKLTLPDLYEIIDSFSNHIGNDKEIIFGLRINPELSTKARVTALATGIEPSVNLFEESLPIFDLSMDKVFLKDLDEELA